MVGIALQASQLAMDRQTLVVRQNHQCLPVSSITPDQPSELMAQTSWSKELPLQQQLANSTREPGQVSLTLDETQLNQLVNDAILNQPQAAQLLANARSIQTMLRSDRIETGAILNLSKVPREALSADIQSGLDQLTRVAPMLSNRDIYVGLIARPQVQDGKISLNQDLSFRLGQFTLPLADVAEHMGFSISDIEQHLNTVIDQQGLTLDNIEILDEQLVITGTKP